MLTLPPYGFYWFYLAGNEHLPAWHTEPPAPMPDYQTVVIKRHLQELLSGDPRRIFEEVLPVYLPKRRWFGSKDEAITSVRLDYAAQINTPKLPVMFSEVVVTNAKGEERYALPLGFLAEEDQHCSPLATQLAISRIRHVRRVGLVTDAFALTSFVHGVFDAFRKGAKIALPEGELSFEVYDNPEDLALDPDVEIKHLGVEQSNSSLIVGDHLMLKLIRKVAAGIHPEVEMGRYLAQAGYANIAATHAVAQRIAPDGTPHVLMLVQEHIHNQGDAWKWSLDTLDRVTRDLLSGGISNVENEFTAMGDLTAFAAVLGKRLGEMHVVLAQPTDNAAFAPETVDAKAAKALAHRVRVQVDGALDTLQGMRDQLDAASQELLVGLLGKREALAKRIEALAADVEGGLRIRVHGDLHLGQVLVAQDDAILIDFEGEPARSLEERRGKYGPYKDVAGVLRSFDYAAAMVTQVSNSGADTSEEHLRLRAQAAETYRQSSYAAFLEAYRTAAADIGHQWGGQGEQAALDLYSLEKAVYEIGYEAANRPTWINIPLRGVAAIVETLLSGARA